MVDAILSPPKASTATHPVIEIFGPTIQGEGAEAGVPCAFVRLGGCDFRCSWCDSMYAVDPAQVRTTARKMSDTDIVESIDRLGGAVEWVVVSGGNPALHGLGPLVSELHRRGFKVAVETQGSVWRDWLAETDRLTVSPKPPSSGMANVRHTAQFDRFMQSAGSVGTLVLKIVCFDDEDLVWAKAVRHRYPHYPLYLSAGTPVPSPTNLLAAVADRFRWLCERVAGDPELTRVRVLPQLHVIAWGDARGV